MTRPWQNWVILTLTPISLDRLVLLKEVPIVQDLDERKQLLKKYKGHRDVFFSFQKAIGTYGDSCFVSRKLSNANYFCFWGTAQFWNIEKILRLFYLIRGKRSSPMRSWSHKSQICDLTEMTTQVFTHRLAFRLASLLTALDFLHLAEHKSLMEVAYAFQSHYKFVITTDPPAVKDLPYVSDLLILQRVAFSRNLEVSNSDV